MTGNLLVEVHDIRRECEDVVSVELRALRSEPLPRFEAGAHVDLHLANGMIRSYSISNSQADSDRYVLGVMREKNSRGGSAFVHEQLRVGDKIEISHPRNNFRLDEVAENFVLIAGGIGVTPIYAMLQRLKVLNKPVRIVYSARSKANAAYLEDIRNLAGSALITHFDDERDGPPNLRQMLSRLERSASYYCCGPAPMLGAFKKACEALGITHAHVEHFARNDLEVAPPTKTYTAELAKTGRSIVVHPGKSLLDTLLDAGIDLPYSCKEGICGACETAVLSGAINHRDLLLTDAEKLSNAKMLICVSGCNSERLVLNI